MPVSAHDEIGSARKGALQNAIIVRIVGNCMEFNRRIDDCCVTFQLGSNGQSIAI